MKKLSSAITWSPEDWGTLRFAPAIDAEEFVKEFAVFGLARCLEDFGVGSFEGNGIAEWFWKTARSWPRKATQSEFNKYARARISDHVGFSRKRADACFVVNSLFDKARFQHVDLDQIVDAIVFLSKTEPIPSEKIIGNGTTTLLDLTRRTDSPKVLKVGADFFPVLQRLYPFERVDDAVVKSLPVGDTSTREFSLVKLAWWFQFPNTTKDEMDNAIRFVDGDRLNWTTGNLFSKWREAAARHDAGVPAEYPEFRDANGDTRTLPNEYAPLFDGSAGLSPDAPAQATKTATALNWAGGLGEK